MDNVGIMFLFLGILHRNGPRLFVAPVSHGPDITTRINQVILDPVLG